jgi:hypothetical protein
MIRFASNRSIPIRTACRTSFFRSLYRSTPWPTTSATPRANCSVNPDRDGTGNPSKTSPTS